MRKRFSGLSLELFIWAGIALCLVLAVFVVWTVYTIVVPSAEPEIFKQGDAWVNAHIDKSVWIWILMIAAFWFFQQLHQETQQEITAVKKELEVIANDVKEIRRQMDAFSTRS